LHKAIIRHWHENVRRSKHFVYKGGREEGLEWKLRGEENADRNLAFPRNVGLADGLEKGTGLEICD